MQPEPWFLRAVQTIDPCLRMDWWPDQQRWWLIRRDCGESFIFPIYPYQQHQAMLDQIRTSDTREEHRWWGIHERARRDRVARQESEKASVAAHVAGGVAEDAALKLPRSTGLRVKDRHRSAHESLRESIER